MRLLNEFKEFAVKGNMMEMAIGIIIGASFNSVIDVLVKQILLPPPFFAIKWPEHRFKKNNSKAG